MPGNLAVERANALLAGEAVAGLRENSDFMESLEKRGNLVVVAREHLDVSSEDIDYIAAMPEVVQEAIRAALHHAIGEGRAVHISYVPGYDFAAHIFDYVTAVGIQVIGPYTVPAARHEYDAS